MRRRPAAPGVQSRPRGPGTPIAVLVVAVLLVAHRAPQTAGVPAPAELRVLFIGNSLTAANDLPALVEAVARTTTGPPLVVEAVTFDGVSLEDHWHRRTAREAIGRGGWNWVVLQQGPSALPESRENLRAWTRRFDGDIRRAGARSALYAVWPSRARAFDFPAVHESYAAAARDVGGRLLPAGDAWRAAWARDRSLELYGRDGFHPSPLGSLLAALVIHRGLAGGPAVAPGVLVLRPGAEAQRLSVDPATASLLAAAAETAVGRTGGVQEKSPSGLGPDGLEEQIPAATYSPTQLPMQYHRR